MECEKKLKLRKTHIVVKIAMTGKLFLFCNSIKAIRYACGLSSVCEHDISCIDVIGGNGKRQQ